MCLCLHWLLYILLLGPMKEFDHDHIKSRNEQRFPDPGEPVCVVCGRYGEYICNEVRYALHLKLLITSSLVSPPVVTLWIMCFCSDRPMMISAAWSAKQTSCKFLDLIRCFSVYKLLPFERKYGFLNLNPSFSKNFQGPSSDQNPDVSSSGRNGTLLLPDFGKDTWDYNRHRWSKRISSLCTFKW